MTTLLILMIYFSFISLGLPDSLLGSSWPISHQFFHVGLSYASWVSLISSGGTVLSSLNSARLIKRYGTFKVVIASIILTSIALWGIALSKSFVGLLIFSIPLGLGGGNVDAALNDFVAHHLEAKHMSWLHSFWGIGASTGPLLMSIFFHYGKFWQGPYLIIAFIQMSLVVLLYRNRSVWKPYENDATSQDVQTHSTLSIMKKPYVKWAMLSFVAYVAMEGSVGLWGSSYVVNTLNFTPDQAAFMGTIFYGSLTVGRILDGFLSMKASNALRLSTSQWLGMIGIAILIFSHSAALVSVSFILMGLGFAPSFPIMMHETPRRFNPEYSQAVISLQMASAYLGFALMPMIIGLLIRYLDISYFPYFALSMVLILILATYRIQNGVFKKKTA